MVGCIFIFHLLFYLMTTGTHLALVRVFCYSFLWFEPERRATTAQVKRGKSDRWKGRGRKRNQWRTSAQTANSPFYKLHSPGYHETGASLGLVLTRVCVCECAWEKKLEEAWDDTKYDFVSLQLWMVTWISAHFGHRLCQGHIIFSSFDASSDFSDTCSRTQKSQWFTHVKKRRNFDATTAMICACVSINEAWERERERERERKRERDSQSHQLSQFIIEVSQCPSAWSSIIQPGSQSLPNYRFMMPPSHLH